MKTCDVFINFRGSDVRYGFLSHLQDYLNRNGVRAFVDEELKSGEEISSFLLEKIENSYISVVIFSENYASSPWCLDELVKILDCMKNIGQVVIPVFYRVDPTHVQELSGRFGDALALHTQKYQDKVKSWSQALQEIAGFSGLDSQNFRPDSKLIHEIMNRTLEILSHMSPSISSDEGLVGIDSRINCVKSLLDLGTPNVQVVGIWGMGGIGKSTLAKIVYNQVACKFSSQCFVQDVRETLEKGTTTSLHNEIFFTLLGPRMSNESSDVMLSPFNLQRLARTKAVIVLDDVTDLQQIERLIGKHDIYGPGSRIIITSRDKQLLNNVDAKIYEVEALNWREALCLFCLHAFKQRISKQGYEALSERMAIYAGGNPLALKVLGSNMYGKSVREWKDELKTLKDTCDCEIGQVLRRSYDRLCKNDKEIFLDIACFFNGSDKDEVISMLDRNGSEIGITRLCDKSLVSISNNVLRVHDLVRVMAKDVICEVDQLGKRRILWRPDDVYDLLRQDEGTREIKGILLNMSQIKELQLKPTAFEKIYNVRHLKFNCSNGRIGVHLPRGLTVLPEELRLFYWYNYPLKSLPHNSFPENLVELRMPDSQLEELWNGDKQLVNLKIIDLSFSKKLRRLQDFSTTPNLDLLKLQDCKSLDSLPNNLGKSKYLRYIDLSYTPIKKLPESIGNLRHLEQLQIRSCCNLHTLPDNIGNLESLARLHVHYSGIKRLPSSINQLQKLSAMDFYWLKGLIFPPLTRDMPCVTRVDLTNCEMVEFPHGVCYLASLAELKLRGNKFESIPETIKQLSKLVTLDLSKCPRLQYLPELPSVQNVYLDDCISLKNCALESLKKEKKLEVLGLSNCINLGKEEYNEIVEYAMAFNKKDEEFKQRRFCIPGSEVPAQIKYKNKRGYYLKLSSSSKSLKELPFCFCAVLDLDDGNFMPWIRCDVYFSDELGQSYIALASSFPNLYYLSALGRHVFLWKQKLSFKQQSNKKRGGNVLTIGQKRKKGIGDLSTNLYTFVFFVTYSGSFPRKDYDCIIECGVHPLFEPTILEQRDENEDGDGDVYYDEERPTPNRLEHTQKVLGAHGSYGRVSATGNPKIIWSTLGVIRSAEIREQLHQGLI